METKSESSCPEGGTRSVVEESIQRGWATRRFLSIALGCLFAFKPSCLTAGAGNHMLTGVVLYGANADGSPAGGAWNTRGGGPGSLWNVYLFTGLVSAPLYLNSLDTEDSLNPKIPLVLGDHVINFAATSTVPGYLGINLYFDNSPSNRITAVVAIDGESSFRVVARGLESVGQNSQQSSSGKLTISWTDDVYSLVLTDFRAFPGVRDMVSAFRAEPDGIPDTIGSFTLSVIPRSRQTSIEVSEVKVCWNTETNKQYQVQYVVNAGDAWVNLGSPVQGDGSPACIKDSVSSEKPRRLYQVMELP